MYEIDSTSELAGYTGDLFLWWNILLKNISNDDCRRKASKFIVSGTMSSQSSFSARLVYDPNKEELMS